MNLDSFIPIEMNADSRKDLLDRGFSRQPLRIDVDIARTMDALAHAAWSIPRDNYYEAGDRYRSLNRLRAEIVDGGVKVWATDETTPYVQLEKYNTTLGGRPREYAPLPQSIAATAGVRKLIAYHLRYLPLSQVGTRYLVNLHLIRFTATPGRPCDTSPPGLHKTEKNISPPISWLAAVPRAAKSSSRTMTNAKSIASPCTNPASATSSTMNVSGTC